MLELLLRGWVWIRLKARSFKVAIDQLPTETAEALGLKGIVFLGADAYDLPFPPKPAAIVI
jgi:hypothetical protein